MRRAVLLMLTAVLMCGTAAATWYDVDSLLYIPGEVNTHLLHNNGSIFYTGIWAGNSTITSGLGGVASPSRPTVFEKDGTWYLVSGDGDGTFSGYHWSGSTWHADSAITSGLGDVGAYSAPIVFEKDGTWYLVSGNSGGGFSGYHWSGSTWHADSAITSGLSADGMLSAPSVFQKDGTWYLVSGTGYGAFSGYHWSGSTWQTDATIASGLDDVGDFTTPTFFQKEGTWYMISGESHGVFSGYHWDGSTWQTDATIASGLDEVGNFSAPTIFEKDGTWCLVSGNDDGTFTGWSTPQIASPDIEWSTNTTITSGLGGVGSYSTPAVFEKEGVIYLISGDTDGTFSGYLWNGSAWQTDATIVSGLGDVYGYSSPGVFQKDGTWYLISGNEYGTFYGYHWSGSTWQADSAITSGLGSSHHYGTHTVFQKDGTWYLIEGGYDAVYGYNWTGSAWQTDSDITSGLGALYYDTPVTFEKKDGTLCLISGKDQGTFSGYYWDGPTWQTDATLSSGLGSVGGYSTPTVFENDGTWYLVSGDGDGTFTGWSAPQNTLTPNTHWTATSLSSEATLNLTYYDLSNQTRGVFAISSGTLDWLRVTDLTTGEYYSTATASGARIETQQAADTTITFTADLQSGGYTVSQTTYPNETGIHGVVYEGTTETNAPIPAVIVTIYNTTWSATTITDSSGYYIFTGLTNDTYALSYKKDRYIDVDYQYVTPTDGKMYSKNVWMQVNTGQFYSRHYVTFCVCSVWGTRYAGVDAICYKEGNIDKTGTTGNDGSVVLSLFEDTEYHITFTNATQGISEDLTLYPRDDYYYILVGDTSPWTEHEHNMYEEIHATVAKKIINDTYVWINVTYKDDLDGTTALDAYINETATEEPPSETAIAHHAFTGDLNDSSYNFTVPMKGGQAYFVRLHCEHTEFGSQWFAYAVRRVGMLVDLGIPSGGYIYICIILILFVGAMFGGPTASTGAIAISALGWVFLAFGWLQPSMGIYGTISVSAASVYAVSVALTHRQREAGYA